MKIDKQNPLNVLSAIIRENVLESDFEVFKSQVNIYLNGVESGIQTNQTEGYFEDLIRKFWQNIYPAYLPKSINKKAYKGNHEADLVIRAGATADTRVKMLLELKTPQNKNEMVSLDNANTKAMWEAITYYLWEKTEYQNHEIKHIVICNLYEWYIIDSQEFSHLFYENNKTLVRKFTDWKQGDLDSTSTQLMYQMIKEEIAKLEKPISAVVIDFRQVKDWITQYDELAIKQLLYVYKIFSPDHLLRERERDDANMLNREFYEELLHIIGVEEKIVEGGTKRIIERKPPNKRDYGSLLENTIRVLETEGLLDRYRDKIQKKYFEELHTEDEETQKFQVGLELVMTWINRLLFMKLLEAQLVSFHNGDKDYRFLVPEDIKDFDGLNTLFFHVLNIEPEKRTKPIQNQYFRIPFLNSSLFQTTDLEVGTTRIAGIQDRLEMPLYKSSILKTNEAKNKTTLPTFEYILKFLNAYDFGAEAIEGKLTTQKRTIINSAVLGLIFEKINGFREGAFFTPSYVTMYMCRKSIRSAIVEKFKQNGYKIDNYEQLKIYWEQHFYKNELRAQGNAIINSLKICDPAVGSGHFLVSALNELIAIKADLLLLSDSKGGVVSCGIEVVNDELLIQNRYTDSLLDYKIKSQVFGNQIVRKVNEFNQKIQQAIFDEKKIIIENCLYGIDVNPISAEICRLRLWIELLKNAYYSEKSNFQAMETLPNLEYKILSGNSLLPMFEGEPVFINWDKGSLGNTESTRESSQLINQNVASIRQVAQKWYNVDDSKQKNKLIVQYDQAKAEILMAKFEVDLLQINMELNTIDPQYKLDKTLSKVEEKTRENLLAQKQYLENRHFETKVKHYYQYPVHYFDWHIQFSEVLGTFKNGNDKGFDVILANPPYFAIGKGQKNLHFTKGRYETYEQSGDIYALFYELGLRLLREGGLLALITPNKWLRTGYGKSLRQMLKPYEWQEIIDFQDFQLFPEATTYVNVVRVKKTKSEADIPVTLVQDMQEAAKLEEYVAKHQFLVNKTQLNDAAGWTLANETELAILQKMRAIGKKLEDFVDKETYYGIKTGKNEVFVIRDEALKNQLINQDAKSAEIILPFLEGKDIRPYQIFPKNQYVIFTRRGINIEQYPAILQYLTTKKDFIMPKPKDWDKRKDWWGRKGGSYQWYEIQDAVDYYKKFEKTKILYPGISDTFSFAMDTQGFYGNDNVQMIVSESRYLLGILNSSLVKFYLKNVCDRVSGGFYRMKMAYINTIPVFEPQAGEDQLIADLVSQIMTMKQADYQANTTHLERQIDEKIFELYGLSENEKALIKNDFE
ncbi:MAG: Eco57I restriction-modification methylase domain-containing protein [Microscillaceae bacterium]|jgi:hypothetical protein|nr:Eco57I restriction-modification methylase domain-containing protein [Microscillaceae bacterium]